MWSGHVGRPVERRGVAPTPPQLQGGTVTKGGHFKGTGFHCKHSVEGLQSYQTVETAAL